LIEDRLNLALIMGCARSGTSILGELIGSHPEVRYKHEAHSVWNKAGLGENGSHRLTAEHATPKVARQIRKRFTEEKGGARLFVEKCPRSVLRIPFIRAVFPEAKLIHIMRDGRDVACSMLPGLGGEEWRHLKPPDWQRLMQEQRGIMRCAHAWKSVMEIALQDLEWEEHFEIKYEELVERPESHVRALMQFLELPEHPAVFEFCRNIQNETADSYHAEKQVKWFREDHRARVGRWRENLNDEEARAVEELLRPMMMELEYET